MATRRSWFRFSLRALLVSVALVSVLFAWLLHSRGRQVRERDRIIAELAGSDSYANFRYTLLGWEVPPEEKWVWLERVASPELKSIVVRPPATKPLPAEVSEVARRAPQVEYEGPHPGKDVDLPLSTSEDTKEIRLASNDLTGDCLAFVGKCPQLLRVNSGYTLLTSESLEALLNHPHIQQIEMHAEEDDLSRVGELSSPSALRRLVLDLQFDPLRPRLEPEPRFDPESNSQIPDPDAFLEPPLTPSPTGDFAWLKQCSRLRKITLNMPHDDFFLKAVGAHLHGVERLDFDMGDPKFLTSLGSWTRLRHLCLDSIQLNDEELARITKLCEGLHTLEIECPTGQITPQGLRSLQALTGLKRLRLGTCNLTVEHLEVIAQLKQIEELSFEDSTVDDEAVALLTTLPKLSRISLERTSASDKWFPFTRGDWNNRRPWRGTMTRARGQRL